MGWAYVMSLTWEKYFDILELPDWNDFSLDVSLYRLFCMLWTWVSKFQKQFFLATILQKSKQNLLKDFCTSL